MEANFSEHINDAVRVLVLLNAVKDRKSIKVTEHKIKLYDYYLKFPYTMLSDDLPAPQQWNFDEYYAFFHWQPDLIRYRQSLNYLQAKGLIEKALEVNLIVFRITDLGVAALNDISSSYKERLVELANFFIPKVQSFSDTKIEQIIRNKSKTCLKSGGVNYESQNKA